MEPGWRPLGGYGVYPEILCLARLYKENYLNLAVIRGMVITAQSSKTTVISIRHNRISSRNRP